MARSGTLQFTATGFEPTNTDVVIVRHILQGLRLPDSQHLPPELALRVLTLAYYCPRLKSRRSETRYYDANDFWAPGPVASVAGLYLTSPPIPKPEERLGEKTVKAKWITFQLRSADQGWADFGGHGTYSNSHTWFDASVLFPIGASNSASRLESSITQTFQTPTDARTVLREHGWEFVQHEGAHTWKVHNNITARSEFTDYRVDWVAGVTTDVENPQAMGDGHEFLEKLTPGCIIALWARAEDQAWQNRVNAATIEVGYESI